MFSRAAVAVGIAGLLAFKGIKSKSLDKSGAMAAFFVGASSLFALPRSGICLLGFYYSSSKLTKYKSDRKSKLDADYKPGGQRNYVQVFSCSLLATLLSAYHYLRVGTDGPVFNQDSSPIHAACMLGIAGHYSCCAADTWASELVSSISYFNPFAID